MQKAAQVAAGSAGDRSRLVAAYGKYVGPVPARSAPAEIAVTRRGGQSTNGLVRRTAEPSPHSPPSRAIRLTVRTAGADV
jgi:hypothetical protein